MGSTARLILPRSEPASKTAPKPAPLQAAPSLPYEVEQPWYGQRRAFRIIVMLLLLNIVAVTSITWGPITVRAWQDHRVAVKAAEAKAKADAAEAAMRQANVTTRTAAVKAALAFQLPVGQVVYTEDWDEAPKLLFAPGGGYSAVPQGAMPTAVLAPPPPPAIAAVSAELRQALLAYVPNPPEGTLFLHERKTPGGQSRLVWVSLRAARQVAGSYTDVVAMHSERQLTAHVLDPAVPASGGFLKALWQLSAPVAQQESKRAEIPVADSRRSGGGRTPPPAAKKGEVMRLLSGRADPNDASRILIDYTLDGTPGTIVMTLQADDRLRFEPDRGTTAIEQFDARGGRVVWRP